MFKIVLTFLAFASVQAGSLRQLSKSTGSFPPLRTMTGSTIHKDAESGRTYKHKDGTSSWVDVYTDDKGDDATGKQYVADADGISSWLQSAAIPKATSKLSNADELQIKTYYGIHKTGEFVFDRKQCLDKLNTHTLYPGLTIFEKGPKKNMFEACIPKNFEECWGWTLYPGLPSKQRQKVDPAHFFNIVQHTFFGEFGTKAQEDQLYETVKADSLAYVPEEFLERLESLHVKYVEEAGPVVTRDEVNLEFARKTCDLVMEHAGFVEDKDSKYTLNMHFPKSDGVTYEHWWLEFEDDAGKKVTIETYPAAEDIKMYGPRARDPENYGSWSKGVLLKPAHRKRIELLLALLKEPSEAAPVVASDLGGCSEWKAAIDAKKVDKEDVLAIRRAHEVQTLGAGTDDEGWSFLETDNTRQG